MVYDLDCQDNLKKLSKKMWITLGQEKLIILNEMRTIVFKSFIFYTRLVNVEDRPVAQRNENPPIDKQLAKNIANSSFEGQNGAVWGGIHRSHPDRFYIHFTPRTTWGKMKKRLNEFLAPLAIAFPVAPIIPIAFRDKIKRAEKPKEFYSFLRDGREDLIELIHALKKQKRYTSVNEIHGVTNYRMARFAMNHLGFLIYRRPGETQTTEEILEKARQDALGARGQDALRKGVLHVYIPKESLFEFETLEKQEEFDAYLEKIRMRAGVKKPTRAMSHRKKILF